LPVLVLSLAATSCLAAPTPSEVLAAGFHTPEQAFATFRTALRGDLVDLEYRCYSSGFKRDRIPSQLVYRKVREELLEEEPLIRWAARARVTRKTVLAEDTVELIACMSIHAVIHRSFRVRLVREDYYETHDAEGLLEDDYVVWDEIARERGGALELSVPMPAGVDVGELVEVRGGREWKIDGFEELSPDDID
jgi:hypothetical protein